MRRLIGELAKILTQFQFTHPVRGATFASNFSSLGSSFQFTHPVRGATEISQESATFTKGFNSRTPCGVRHLFGGRWYQYRTVSIHAPRAGCDSDPSILDLSCSAFQFTHPVRGATRANRPLGSCQGVSIHAPRAGCDTPRQAISQSAGRFNSRTPCGVRHRQDGTARGGHDRFNSRTPCGVRRRSRSVSCRLTSFNSRTPCGVRLMMVMF